MTTSTMRDISIKASDNVMWVITSLAGANRR